MEEERTSIYERTAYVSKRIGGVYDTRLKKTSIGVERFPNYPQDGSFFFKVILQNHSNSGISWTFSLSNAQKQRVTRRRFLKSTIILVAEQGRGTRYRIKTRDSKLIDALDNPERAYANLNSENSE